MTSHNPLGRECPVHSCIDAEAARASLSRIMVIAGHDLRQPLQVALLGIETAIDDSLSPAAQGKLNIAMDAIERLARELGDIAVLSQQMEILSPRYTSVCVADLFETLKNEWSFYARARNVSVALSECDLSIWSDAMMLRSVLRNIVGNAIKFAGHGGHVSICCRRLSCSALIEIEDNGPGLPDGFASRIFEPFNRGSRAAASDGLGLGLTIVREIADLLSIPVSVRSAEGIGSTFCIELPLCDDAV